MPCEGSWYQNQRVIYWRVWGQITLEDIAQLGKEQQKMLKQGLSPIHVIVNILSVGDFPTDIRQIKDSLDGMNHPNLGWVLVVGTTSPIKRFVTTTVAQMVVPDLRLRMFNAMDEAFEFLKHVDETVSVAQR